MTACVRAADGQSVAAKSTEVSNSVKARPSQRMTWRGVVSLFLQDVLTGMRRVSHNALAMLGLVAVVAVVFLAGRVDVRHGLETRVLSWLTERAAVRAGAQASADGQEPDEVLLAMAEPDAIQRATAANPADLNRQQANVAYWLARRYSVAPEPVSRLVQEAWAVGRRVGVEPTLVLAVMAVESGFNPFAQSHVGAQGLMQVMTRVHHDKYQIFGGMAAAFDPVTNLRVGAQVLKDCIRRAGSLEGGLKAYVGAANMADDGGYGAKVLAERAFLRQVAAGQKVAVNSPLPQATPIQALVQSRGAELDAEAQHGAHGTPEAHQPEGGPSAPSTRQVEHVALLAP